MTNKDTRWSFNSLVWRNMAKRRRRLINHLIYNVWVNDIRTKKIRLSNFFFRFGKIRF